MSRLKILPEAYYDLTLAETLAMLDGETGRELATQRLLRRIATLIRNAHFTKPVSETDYLPLPGDHEIDYQPETTLSAKEFIKAFGAAFRDSN